MGLQSDVTVIRTGRAVTKSTREEGRVGNEKEGTQDTSLN